MIFCLFFVFLGGPPDRSIINNFPLTGEEFMRYLLSATFAGGMASRSRVQAKSPFLSLPSTSTAPESGGLRLITTTTHG